MNMFSDFYAFTLYMVYKGSYLIMSIAGSQQNKNMTVTCHFYFFRDNCANSLERERIFQNKWKFFKK